MKRTAVLVLLALTLLSAAAQAAGIGVGAFGGVSIPLLQDDTGKGSTFGARVPVSLVSLLTVEPFFASSSGGDAEEEFGGVNYTRTGLDLSAYGANVLIPFGAAVRFFPFAGIGSYKVKREGAEDITKTGYNFGLGLGFSPPLAGISIDVRGEMTAVVDGDVSRKWANATVGVTYSFIKLAAK